MKALEIPRVVYQRWQNHDGAMLAASVAFYMSISLFPVMLLLTSGLGMLMKWTHVGNDANAYVVQAISEQLSPELGGHLQVALDQVKENAGYSGRFGAVMLLMTALAIFAQFEQCFDRIWQVRQVADRPWSAGILSLISGRVRAFFMLASLGFGIVGVFVAGVIFDAFKAHSFASLQAQTWLWWSLETALGVTLNAIVFGLLYRWLPKTMVRRFAAFTGGMIAAVTWEIGRQLLSAFVIGQQYASAYGVIGSLMAVMVWGYYAISVVLIGAIFTQVIDEQHAPQPRSVDAKTRSCWPLSTLDLMCATCILYIGSFLVLRESRTYDIPTRSPEGVAAFRVVLFSIDPAWQDGAIRLFAPLIALAPGSRRFPAGKDLQRLLASDPVTVGDPRTLRLSDGVGETEHSLLTR